MSARGCDGNVEAAGMSGQFATTFAGLGVGQLRRVAYLRGLGLLEAVLDI